MSDTESANKPRKPWPRTARLAQYAMVLLAVLLWTRHEQTKRHAGQAAEISAQKKNAARNQRIKAAFALVEKVDSVSEPAEKIRIYDEIIATYQDDKATPFLRCVSWALYQKAQLVTDAAEKSRLYETVINKYCNVADKTVKGYVTGALRGALRQFDSGAEKIAFCDAILEKNGSRLPDSLAAEILHKKAESIRDADEAIAVYDTILSRFLTSKDDSAFDTAIIVTLDKMKLITDEAEQLRLCDIAIDAFLKTPDRTRYYLFQRAIEKKAQLVGDPSLPLAMWNQVIANNVTEASVVQARSLRMPLLKDDKERLAACDEFIAVHQDSKSDFVQMMVVRAMMRKARLITNTTEKMALLRSVVEKCATIEDSRAKDEANSAVEMLAELSGDKASATRYYDNFAANAENRLDAIRALKSKVRLVNDSAEKIRLYDEILAMIGDSSDTLESREAVGAILQKIRFIDDKEEKIKLYDDIIARGKDHRDFRMRQSAADAMLEKGRLLEDKKAQISLYDEIIARGMEGGDKDWLESAAKAMAEKAKLVEDRGEKIRLYDTVLFNLRQISGRYFLQDALRERVGLASGSAEKSQLYDRFLAAAGDDLMEDTRISLLLEKAAVIEDPSDRSRAYDEVIDVCERKLNAGRSGGGGEPLGDYERNSLLDHLGKAVIAKADLAGSDAEKLNLYDKYLAFPQTNRHDFLSTSLKTILSRKAALSGDPTTASKYFDDQIQSAATDRERVNWYVRKAHSVETALRAPIEEEMVAKFFDSPDKEIEGIIAGAFMGKIRRTPDPDEKDKLCDRLIERYQDSTDTRALLSVVQAYAVKAETAKDDDTKLAIYSAAIDRYGDIDEFFVKRIVNDIIAARFRLEAKRKK